MPRVTLCPPSVSTSTALLAKFDFTMNVSLYTDMCLRHAKYVVQQQHQPREVMDGCKHSIEQALDGAHTTILLLGIAISRMLTA